MNLILAFSAILICFFVSEVFTRIIYKDKIGLFPRYQSDAQYGEYRLRRMLPNIEFWHKSIDGKWKYKINKLSVKITRSSAGAEALAVATDFLDEMAHSASPISFSW